MRLFFRVRVIDLQRIPAEGPVLVLPRHRRLIDIPPGFTAIYAGETIDPELADRRRAVDAQISPDFAIAGVYILSLCLALDACPQDQGIAVAAAYRSVIATSDANAFL